MCYVMLAFVMRFPRVKAQGRSFYHCISRFVHGLYIFGTSGGRCAEAEEFLSLMRRWAALTGIRIRKYVLMANHFHIMCEGTQYRDRSKKHSAGRVKISQYRDRSKNTQCRDRSKFELGNIF
jgi:acetyltransferase-like isoleucine patch superfamily enzyme